MPSYAIKILQPCEKKIFIIISATVLVSRLVAWIAGLDLQIQIQDLLVYLIKQYDSKPCQGLYYFPN